MTSWVYDIDWAASGAWFQGWAALGGAAAIVYAAHKGAATFTAWKRQKVEERRMEVAEQVLVAADRFRSAIRDVRRRGITGKEWIDAEAVIDGLNALLKATTNVDEYRIAQVIMTRFNQHHEDWNAILDIGPVALAYFGPEVREQLDILSANQLALAISVEMLPSSASGGLDPDVLGSKVQARQAVFGGESDKIGPAIDAAIAKLNELLRPILRPEHIKVERKQKSAASTRGA